MFKYMTYRILYKIIRINAAWSVVLIPLILLLSGCRDDKTVTAEQEKIQSVWTTSHEDKTDGEGKVSVDTNVCDKGSSIGRIPDLSVRVRGGDALVLETNGLKLSATGDAVKHSGVYSVTLLTEHELPPLPQGMVNMTAGGADNATAGYRLLPSGDHFDPPAELRVEYDPTLLPPGYTADDIYTSYFDSASMAWVRLERVGVDTATHEIVSFTTHFTDFVNELLKAPEMPETQAFVPTAMSSLEAANPMEGISLMQPPVVMQDGTASLCYPLDIPAGRGGMQPSLALTYSSGGGSGWLGEGWDIPIPSITIDTRWGVPRYDPDKESEVYMYKGEQLVARNGDGKYIPLPHRTTEWSDRLPDGTQFSVVRLSRHCASGLYRVIHISPHRGDWQKPLMCKSLTNELTH